jgi:hypothetical protein
VAANTYLAMAILQYRRLLDQKRTIYSGNLKIQIFES